MNEFIQHWQKFEKELTSLEKTYRWLLQLDGLKAADVDFYQGYIDAGFVLLQRKPTPKTLKEGKWNKEHNFREGSYSISGTHSEMLIEAACRGSNTPIDYRVVEKDRQKFGEDLVIQGFSTSSKSRRHVGNGVDLYFNDFKPAVWRVARLALVDRFDRRMTFFDYPTLAKEYCEIDEGGFCTPQFQREPFTIDLIVYGQKHPGSLHTVDVEELLQQRLSGEGSYDKNN